MKKIFCILISLLLYSPLISQEDLPLQRFNAPLITSGIITRFSPHLIPDNSVQDALNVLFDEDIGIVRRNGYSKFNTVAIGSSTGVRGLWDFTANDGTRYIMAVSNGNLYESDGDGTFATVTGITGLTTTAQYDAVPYLGEFWLTNGVNNVKSWDGASATDVSTAPKGTMIEGWRNRIIISGVSGNQSRVYLSEELVGSNFTTGPTLSTSPVILSIGGIDAKPIKCLYAGYKDTMIVFTEDEIYAVYGFGFDDFAVRRVSNEVGCIDDRTVREKDGNLVWLSRRGLERWRGTEITRISDPIRDLFDNIIGNIADNRFIIDTTQADWEEGNLVAGGALAPISATQIPLSIEPTKNIIQDTDFTAGSLDVAGNFVATDGSINNIAYDNTTDVADEWNEGTFVDTELSVDTLQLLFEDKIPDNASPCEFLQNQSVAAQGWTSGSGCGCNIALRSPCATAVVGTNDNKVVRIMDVVTEKISKSIGPAAGFTRTFTSSELYSAGLILGNTYQFRHNDTQFPDTRYIEKSFVWWGSDIVASGLFGNGFELTVADAEGYSPTGTYTSEVFDTVSTQPNYTLLQATETKPANTDITYEIAVSDDGVNFDSFVSVSNGGDPNPNNKQYFKYRINMSHTENDTPTVDDIQITAQGEGTYTSVSFDTGFLASVGGDFNPTFTDATPIFSVRQSTDDISFGGWSTITDGTQIALTQRYWQYKIDFTSPSTVTEVELPSATEGQYIHACFNPGTFTDWGLLQANDITTDGGSIAYAVVSGASCAAVELVGASWLSQPNNTKIVAGVNTYIGVRETFTLTAAESQAIVQDVTINYNVGGTSKPLASVVYDDRYLLAFDSDVGGNNDKIAILDKRDKWTIFDNITCASMSLYNRKWHCGTSETDGFVYLMDTGFNDDGGDYTASFRTKAYWLNDQDAEKEFNKLYVSLLTDNTAPVPTIAVTYRLDDSSTALSLGSLLTNEDSTSGILQAKVPFPQSQNLTGRYIDFEFSNTGQRPWTIFNFNIYYKVYPVK